MQQHITYMAWHVGAYTYKQRYILLHIHIYFEYQTCSSTKQSSTKEWGNGFCLPYLTLFLVYAYRLLPIDTLSFWAHSYYIRLNLKYPNHWMYGLAKQLLDRFLLNTMKSKLAHTHTIPRRNQTYDTCSQNIMVAQNKTL